MLELMGKKILTFLAEKFCLSKPVCMTDRRNLPTQLFERLGQNIKDGRFFL